MSKTIKVKCTNTLHCDYMNEFSSDDLVSEMPLKDDAGNILIEQPPVKIDSNTFVQCEKCGYPINCADATVSD